MFSRLNDRGKKAQLWSSHPFFVSLKNSKEPHKVFLKTAWAPENFVSFLITLVSLIIDGKLSALKISPLQTLIWTLTQYFTQLQITPATPHAAQEGTRVYLYDACSWPLDKMTRIHVACERFASHRVSPQARSEAAVRWTVTSDKWQCTRFPWRKGLKRITDACAQSVHSWATTSRSGWKLFLGKVFMRSF